MPRRRQQVHEILGPVAHYRRLAGEWMKASNVKRARFVELLKGVISKSEFDKLMSPAGPRPVIRGEVLAATAKATNTPVEMWAGSPGTQSHLYDWVVAEHPEYADSFWGAVSTSLASAESLIGWGVVLPCSLTPVTFMRAHHKALAAQLYESPADAESFSATFNRKGQERRERFQKARYERPWNFVHLMFADDLKGIMQGQGVYASIPVRLRRDCIAQLLQYVQKEEWRVEVRIVDSRAATDGLRARLRAAGDSVVVVQSKHDSRQGMLFMRDAEGNIRWSLHSRPVGRRLDQLLELRRLARPHPKGTERFLEQLIGRRSNP